MRAARMRRQPGWGRMRHWRTAAFLFGRAGTFRPLLQSIGQW
jgi:hypothetical protein